MGNPAFYVNYDAVGTLEVIDLGEEMSDIQCVPVRLRTDAYDGGYSAQSVVHGGTERVRLVLENFTSKPLERALRTLSSHLERNGSIGFTMDTAKTYLGYRYSSHAWKRGDASLTTNNAFTAWSSAGFLAADDDVTIESANPELFREYSNITSISGSVSTANKIVLSPAMRISFSTSLATICRWRWFWPVLRLPEDQLGTPIVTDDHRIAYTLDVELEYDINATAALVHTELDIAGPYQGGTIPFATTTIGALAGGRKSVGPTNK